VVVIVSILVAVGAVSVLIYVLFKSTTGPGQTLRRYYDAVSADDCGSAYVDLSDPLQHAILKDRFCTAVDGVKGNVPTSITIDTVTGCGEPPAQFAKVTITEHGPSASAQPVVWHMIRQGDDWRIASFPELRRIARSEPPPAKPRVPADCR
jgi:hypothetical protein